MTRMFSRLLVLGMVVWAGPEARAQPLHPAALAEWQPLELPQSHTRVDYPAGIFLSAGASEKGIGERFRSRDGGATLSVYAQTSQKGETPGSYLQDNLQINPSAIQYKRVTRSFFAISMERGGKIYYSRCNFSSRPPGGVHCFDLVYPQREKRAWDAIVTRISLSLRPLEG